MNVNVEDQVADVEDLDDLENIEAENNAPYKSRQHKKGSEEKINVATTHATLATRTSLGPVYVAPRACAVHLTEPNWARRGDCV